MTCPAVRWPANAGPARHEFAKIWHYRRHRRLLQHDFAEPDVVRLGPNVRFSSPRQVTVLNVVPAEQALTYGFRVGGFGHGPISIVLSYGYGRLPRPLINPIIE